MPIVTTVLDSFTGTDGDNFIAHTPNVGGLWSGPGITLFTWFILGNKAKTEGGPSQSTVYIDTVVDVREGDEVYCEITQAIPSTSGNLGLFVAAEDSTGEKGYAIVITQQSSLLVSMRLAEREALNVYSTGTLVSNIPWTSGTAKRVGLKVVDESPLLLQMWLEPVGGGARTVIGTFAPGATNYITAGDHRRVGLISNTVDADTGQRFDNFTFIDLQGGSPPTAEFSSSEITTWLVGFTDLSTDVGGTIVSWAWTFGDGGVSTLQNPTHLYENAGTYTVTLTVTDDDGLTDDVSHDILLAVPYCFYVPFTCSSDPAQAVTQISANTPSFMDVIASRRIILDDSCISVGTLQAVIWIIGDGSDVGSGIVVGGSA